MLTGNKGEWSEIYTLLKLLSEGNLYSGDADFNRIQNLFYPIIKILRKETENDLEYVCNGDIIIIRDNIEELRIPISKFEEQALFLFEKIKSSTNGVFSIPEIESFLKLIHCKTLKAKSSVKTDIRIVIHDLKTNTKPELGFSIKSQLGSPSTLLNASSATNLIYKLSYSISKEKVEEFNSYKFFKDKFDRLNELGCNLNFIKTENKIFGNNLVLIDSLLPDIIAKLLILYNSTKESSIINLTNQLKQLNPLNYDMSNEHNFYEYKIKHLLTDIALGLMPTKVWNGLYDATGGYLVVKEDGDILAYHIYNKNEFENYLFNNTRLETASTSRHEFGNIYTENDNQFIKLNLQIRFIK